MLTRLWLRHHDPTAELPQVMVMQKCIFAQKMYFCTAEGVAFCYAK